MRWNDFVFLPGIIIELLGVIVLVAGGITGRSVLLISGIVIICIGSALTTIRIIRRARKGAGSPGPGIQAPADAVSEKQGDSTVLYQDHLVSVSGNSITFHHYSFPFFLSDRQVYFREIVRIDVKRTALGTGKWRIAGSGDFRTWFPMDWDRPSRDRTFVTTLKSGWWTIGFTVENSSRVLSLLKEQGLPIVESGE